MRIKHIGIALWMMLSASVGVNAQNTSCDDAVLEAKRSYEAGQFSACISRLEPCLPEISDLTMRATGYRLLSLAYLASGNSEKANEYAVELLKVQPDYQKFPQIDPAEFTKIINSYIIEEKVLIGFQAGLNHNMVERITSYSSYQSSQSYPVSRGFQAGINIDYSLNKNFYLSSFWFLGGISIQHHIDDLENFRQEYNEEQRYVGTQLMANGRIALGSKIHFNFGLGGGVGHLFESMVELNTINKETKSVQAYTMNALEYRNRFQPFLSGSLGLSLQLGKGEFMLHMQYDHFLKNTLSNEHRYADLDFNLSNHYVNDDIRNRVFSYSIGYRHPIVFKINKIEE